MAPASTQTHTVEWGEEGGGGEGGSSFVNELGAAQIAMWSEPLACSAMALLVPVTFCRFLPDLNFVTRCAAVYILRRSQGHFSRRFDKLEAMGPRAN